MTLLLLLILAVLACTQAALLGLVIFVGRRGDLLRRRARPTVVVHTRRPDDQSIRGVLLGDYADRVVLRDAIYLYASGEQAAAGLVHIPRATISTMQELPADAPGQVVPIREAA